MGYNFRPHYGLNPWKNFVEVYRGNYNNAAQFFKDVSGYSQYEQTKRSNQAQIDYDTYLRRGNERALADWKKNVPGRSIRYPELSYPGAIYRSNTGVARSMYSSDSALSNFAGNVVYRGAGLYHVAGGVSRRM